MHKKNLLENVLNHHKQHNMSEVLKVKKQSKSRIKEISMITKKR